MKILYIELNGYKRFLLNQIDHFSMHLPSLVQLVIGTNGSGKAQPLDASIRVPSGWANMGSMKVGTDVIAKDGTTTKVTGVFPKGQKEIFKVTFLMVDLQSAVLSIYGKFMLEVKSIQFNLRW